MTLKLKRGDIVTMAEKVIIFFSPENSAVKGGDERA